jgi:hypothetical protein
MNTADGTPTIWGNQATYNGGGVAVYHASIPANSTFTMNGGTITGNTSDIPTTGVGGVYNNGGTVNGTGLGGITGNIPINSNY